MLKLFIFTDDTNVFCTWQNLSDVVTTQQAKNMVRQKQTINKSTQNNTFGHRKMNQKGKLRIKDAQVRRADGIKLQGIDHELSWKGQVKNVA